MTSKFLGSVVAAGCVVAAGAGGYLAVRSTATGSAAVLPVGTTPPRTLGISGSAPAPSATPSELSREAQYPTPSLVPPRPPTQASARRAPATLPQVVQQEDRSPQEAAEGALTPIAAPTAEPDATAATPGPAASTIPTPRPVFEDVVLPAEAVIGIRLDTTVSSETSQIEDRVAGRVTRDVIVDGRTVIPAGTQIAGNVSLVQRGGKLRERARVGVRFSTLMMRDEVRIGIQTEAIFRDGDAPGGEATAKIGASAVIGSILGGVFGGKKGAAIGGAAGAAGGTAVVMTGDRNEAILPAGTPLTVRLSAPVTLRLERIQ